MSSQPSLAVNGDEHVPGQAQRKWIAIGIVLFLASQTIIPLSYYLRSEPTSERFAWRMFSSIDLSTWKTRVTVLVEQNGNMIEREVPLPATLQETWVKTVERAQFDIVEPFMRRLASQDGVREVRFVAQGTFPSGKPMEPIQLSLKPGGDVVNLAR